MWAYDDSRAAIRDALRLSRAMTLKAAVADLALGGGKGVIMVRPGTPLSSRRRRDALLDFADTVQACGGRYVTAEDVGTSSRDMRLIAGRTEHVAGLARGRGGSGDPSPMTALGVEAAISAACERAFGSTDLRERTIAVVGLGHVGSRLLVADVDPDKRRLAAELGGEWMTPERALTAPVDVLVPCALGGFLDDESVPRLRCRVIAGAANNQLAEDRIADLLATHEILWAPDFVVNAGGLINIAEEVGGYDAGVARRRVRSIADTLGEIFAHAESFGVTPLAAAMEMARRRLVVAGARGAGGK